MLIETGSVKDHFNILQLIEVNKQSFPFYKQDMFSKQLFVYLEQGLSLCAYDNDILIGFLGFHKGRKQLDLICVREGYRRNHVATSLLKKMLQQFSIGDTIHVQVSTKDKAMIALLLSMRFQEQKKILLQHHSGSAYIYNVI